MSIELTPDEVFRLTKPISQPAAQVRHLRRMGIRAERRADGSVLVLHAWLALPANDGAKSRPRLKSDQRAA